MNVAIQMLKSFSPKNQEAAASVFESLIQGLSSNQAVERLRTLEGRVPVHSGLARSSRTSNGKRPLPAHAATSGSADPT